MGSRWGPDGPPPEAYGRATDQQRFAAVVAEADRLVADLERRYDVRVDRSASWPVPEPLVRGGVERVVRLAPAAGAPLVLAVTGLPGVLGWSGSWSDDGVFPACGCDACDETADDVVEHLRGWVASVVLGRSTERLSRWPRERRTTRSWPGGGTGSGSPLDRERFQQLAGLAPPGEHVWPAWPPRRAAAVAPTT